MPEEFPREGGLRAALVAFGGLTRFMDMAVQDEHQAGSSASRRVRSGAARRWAPTIIALLTVLVVGSACDGSSSSADDTRATTTARSQGSTSTTPTSTSGPTSTTTPTTGSSNPDPSVRERLAVLIVDDRPSPQGQYRREDWPHWADVEGNGCDARQDALVAWSIEPATVNRSSGCRVVAGSWVSPYDGMASNNPSDFDVDHLVPLADAFDSGGWQWTAERRRAFANDPAELVVASASSNRSKGSQSPDQWRPADRSSWCAYADGWVDVKSSWGLTVTTSERDALGQMLDTCGPAGAVWPRGGGAPIASPAPEVSGGSTGGGASTAPPGGSPPPADVYYANCTAARAAGAAPILRGQPGYRSALDRDNDGIACE